MANQIEIQQMPDLEKLLISGEMEKKLQKIIRNVLSKARERLSADISSQLPNDPRKAYKAVRKAVYKQILGGNLNILTGKSRGGNANYAPARTLRDGQRGGNRRSRSARTEQVDSYEGADRGFILRFLNSGTADRETKYGRRGHIAPRNFFAQEGQKEMETAAQEISELISQEIANTQF